MTFRLVGYRMIEPALVDAMPLRREASRFIRSANDPRAALRDRLVVPLGEGWRLALSRNASGAVGLALLVWALIVAVLLSF